MRESKWFLGKVKRWKDVTASPDKWQLFVLGSQGPFNAINVDVYQEMTKKKKKKKSMLYIFLKCLRPNKQFSLEKRHGTFTQRLKLRFTTPLSPQSKTTFSQLALCCTILYLSWRTRKNTLIMTIDQWKKLCFSLKIGRRNGFLLIIFNLLSTLIKIIKDNEHFKPRLMSLLVWYRKMQHFYPLKNMCSLFTDILIFLEER